MSLHIFGIRHHGPGSARHLMAALDALEPDVLLVEGPPEGEAVLTWMAHADMVPPVALLGYVPDDPKRASFYPFAAFSPEWNAIRYGLKRGIPVRFMDMPLSHRFALRDAPEEGAPETPPEYQVHPFAALAALDGFDDEEEWWEHRFEIASYSGETFDVVAEMITALREAHPGRTTSDDQIREAFMRRTIRQAQKELFAKVAVVCGAWHVPALTSMPPQKADDALLRGLPRAKVETSWIPWTHDRLSFESGYGAGVVSPGWYTHHWQYPDDDGPIWLTHTAQVFRRHQVDISSAHVIESVRLARTLADLRLLARPGLKELSEATRAVMCMGDESPMQLVRKDLIVGNVMGRIPEGTPQLPIQRDLDLLLKRFRLKMSPDEKVLKLDLREDNDRQKSILLHRLQVLGVSWGSLRFANTKGTFREEWALRWFPEMTIQLLEKAPWGNTIEAASNGYLGQAAAECTKLEEITRLVETALPAELHDGIRAAMKRLDELAASTSDTTLLMGAFLPLARMSRYGSVRQTDLNTVRLLVTSIFYRVVAGLPGSASGIDDEQATALAAQVSEVHRAINLLDDDSLREPWYATLVRLADGAAPGIQGTACKLLYDAGIFDQEETANRFSRALSTGAGPAFSACWLEGFLRDAAIVLLLDDVIWNIVNEWVVSLSDETFLTVIPLMRRTFALYASTEKQKIAEKAAHGPTATQVRTHSDTDHARAAAILPVLHQLLGLPNLS